MHIKHKQGLHRHEIMRRTVWPLAVSCGFTIIVNTVKYRFLLLMIELLWSVKNRTCQWWVVYHFSTKGNLYSKLVHIFFNFCIFKSRIGENQHRTVPLRWIKLRKAVAETCCPYYITISQVFLLGPQSTAPLLSFLFLLLLFW